MERGAVAKDFAGTEADKRRKLLVAKIHARRQSHGMTLPSLDHLPAAKRHELAFVLEVLSEEFARKTAHRSTEGVAGGELLKVILYGSYARGEWVEDPIGRYFSDYDLLIVVSHEKLTDFAEFWADAERRLAEALAEGKQLRTPVSLIVHSIDDINNQLAKGRYFFVDIAREGITLLSKPGHALVEPKPMAASAALTEAQRYFADGLRGAHEAIAGVDFYVERESFNFAAFLAHQSAERLYQTLLLVMTLHSPKSHNLSRLRAMTDGFDERLIGVWPTETKFQKRAFELLKQGYVNARYSEHYIVTPEELSFIRERIEVLGSLVMEICQQQLSALSEASASA